MCFQASMDIHGIVNKVVSSVMRKPFTCHVCATGFTRQDNLRAHLRRHHHEGGDAGDADMMSDNSRSPAGDRSTDSPGALPDLDGKASLLNFRTDLWIQGPYLT